MSEIESRPTRGRSSTRGGRGSYGRGGPRGGRSHANGHATEPVEESFEDQGELGEMKKKYQSELGMLKDMFPDWTDTDLVFALEEADGDIPATVDKITQGAVSQFSEVKKPKDRARSKAKEDITPASFSDKTGSGSRARGRGGLESTRGGRARGTERGRGGHRGGRGGHATTNGTAKDSTDISAPTAEHPTEDISASTDAADSSAVSAAPATTHVGEVASKPVISSSAGADVAKTGAAPESGAKKSWASMFAQPKPVPAAVPKKAATPQPAVAEPPVAPTQSEAVAPEAEEATQIEPAAVPEIQEVLTESVDAPAERPETSEGDAANLTPSTVPLTEANVEELPDDSVPPTTFTAASTTGSMDPRNLTPLPQAPIGRPALGGYATSANRLAGTGGRTASFQRRLKEQQEAVVMPGHSAVDRAAVQFGSMGLSGEQGMDVDEEREEPETRQAPQHSPPSQPRTSLPPAPRHGSDQPEVVPSAAPAVPTPKQAPGLPPASAQNQQQIQDPTLSQSQSHEPQASQYGQYGRYNQPGLQPDLAAQSQQKQHYDPFGHQTQNQYDQYGAAHSQHQPHAQQQQQSSLGGLSSGPNDYPGYYTSEQQRLYSPYGAYGGSYGQPDSRSQSSQNQQDPSAIGQQRSASGFGSAQGDSGFGGQTQGQAPSRFGDTHGPGSGNNTPNPPPGGQQQHQQSAPQSQHSQQGAYGGAGSGFPYGHQYYNSPYPQAYQAQFYQPTYGSYGSQGNKGYGGNPYSGNQSMGSQGYESSSPAPGAPFGQTQSSNRAASGSSALLDDYNRGSSAQGFNGMNDFSQRSSSGFGSHGYNGQQQGLGGSTQPESSDALKPFGNDTSSSKSGPAQRPGSAVGSQQSGNIAPQQSQHNTGNFGGYQNYSGQGQYLGGLGAQQSGQSAYGGQQSQGGYAGYGAGGFNQTYGQGYGGGNARGGWGQNYSQGQH